MDKYQWNEIDNSDGQNGTSAGFGLIRIQPLSDSNPDLLRS